MLTYRPKPEIIQSVIVSRKGKYNDLNYALQKVKTLGHKPIKVDITTTGTYRFRLKNPNYKAGKRHYYVQDPEFKLIKYVIEI